VSLTLSVYGTAEANKIVCFSFTRSDSVDLSGELYADEGNLRTTTAGPSTTSEAASQQQAATQAAPPKRKSGFRAAMGAVRELLR